MKCVQDSPPLHACKYVYPVGAPQRGRRLHVPQTHGTRHTLRRGEFSIPPHSLAQRKAEQRSTACTLDSSKRCSACSIPTKLACNLCYPQGSFPRSRKDPYAPQALAPAHPCRRAYSRDCRTAAPTAPPTRSPLRCRTACCRPRRRHHHRHRARAPAAAPCPRPRRPAALRGCRGAAAEQEARRHPARCQGRQHRRHRPACTKQGAWHGTQGQANRTPCGAMDHAVTATQACIASLAAATRGVAAANVSLLRFNGNTQAYLSAIRCKQVSD